jgi:hypothetical protein
LTRFSAHHTVLFDSPRVAEPYPWGKSASTAGLHPAWRPVGRVRGQIEQNLE